MSLQSDILTETLMKIFTLQQILLTTAHQLVMHIRFHVN